MIDLLFGKKKKEGVPIEQVKKLMLDGRNEREIVQSLKKEGYELEQIERAMMRAMQTEVGDEVPGRMGAGMEEKPFGLQDIYSSQQQEEKPVDMTEEMPEELIEPEYMEPQEEPDVLMEELVQGIIEDKWKKFQDETDKFRDQLADVKAEVKSVKSKLSEPRQEETKIDEIEIRNRLEDMDIRINGLEKAFRQFLPSLTRNIESLSDLVHEAREKKAVS